MTGCLRHSHRRVAGPHNTAAHCFPTQSHGRRGERRTTIWPLLKKKMYIYYCSHSSELLWIDVYCHTTRSCVTSCFHASTPECHPSIPSKSAYWLFFYPRVSHGKELIAQMELIWLLTHLSHFKCASDMLTHFSLLLLFQWLIKAEAWASNRARSPRLCPTRVRREQLLKISQKYMSSSILTANNVRILSSTGFPRFPNPHVSTFSWSAPWNYPHQFKHHFGANAGPGPRPARQHCGRTVHRRDLKPVDFWIPPDFFFFFLTILNTKPDFCALPGADPPVMLVLFALRAPASGNGWALTAGPAYLLSTWGSGLEGGRGPTASTTSTLGTTTSGSC